MASWSTPLPIDVRVDEVERPVQRQLAHAQVQHEDNVDTPLIEDPVGLADHPSGDGNPPRAPSLIRPAPRWFLSYLVVDSYGTHTRLDDFLVIDKGV